MVKVDSAAAGAGLGDGDGDGTGEGRFNPGLGDGSSAAAAGLALGLGDVTAAGGLGGTVGVVGVWPWQAVTRSTPAIAAALRHRMPPNMSVARLTATTMPAPR